MYALTENEAALNRAAPQFESQSLTCKLWQLPSTILLASGKGKIRDSQCHDCGMPVTSTHRRNHSRALLTSILVVKAVKW